MKRAVNVLASLALLALALHYLDIGALLRAAKRVGAVTFVAAVLVNFVGIALQGMRWNRIVASIAPLPFAGHLRHYLTATFLNSFTPANLGGDAYRIMALRPAAGATLPVAGALIRERVLGLAGYLLVYLVTFAVNPRLHVLGMPLFANPFVYAALVAVAVMAGLFLVRPLLAVATPWLERGALRKRVLGLARDVGGQMVSLDGLVPLSVLTLAGIAAWLVSIRLVASDLGLALAWRDLAAVAVIVEIIRLVPITVQGLGLREAGFAYLLALLGYNAAQVFVTAAVAYLALSVAILCAGPVGYGLRFLKAANGAGVRVGGGGGAP